MSDDLRVNIIFRSRGIQLSLLAAMRAADAWGRVGLDPGPDIPWVEKAADGDRMLEAGEVHFIFGSHVTPYIRFGDGVPFVYLGQSVNWSDDVVITATPITGVEDLRGRRIAERLSRDSHSRGNRVLFLRRAGIAEDQVEWVDRGQRTVIDAVADHDADAGFMSPIDAANAHEHGLHVHVPPPLPMVVGSTMTTLWPTVEREPELCRRVLRAVRIGVRFFQSEPERMRSVMSDVVGPALDIRDADTLELLYRRNAGLLEADLYPRNEAIGNAFALAVRQRPGLEQRVKPQMLWDLHFLRELDAAGVVD